MMFGERRVLRQFRVQTEVGHLSDGLGSDALEQRDVQSRAAKQPRRPHPPSS